MIIDCLLQAVKSGHKEEAKFLLDKCNCDPNVKDENGDVLLTLTKDSEIILFLIKHGAQTDAAFRAITRKHGLRRLSSFRPPENPVPIFFVGEGGAGKSTVLKSLQSQKSKEKPKTVTGVDEKTVGIITDTLQLSSRDFNCYDLAGQKEFHASHSPALKNAVQTSSPVVLCCVDLRKSDKDLAESVKYWMSLVKNQVFDLESKPHVIVIGSHSDELESEKASQKGKIFPPIVKKYKTFEYINFVAMDCRCTNTREMKQLADYISLCGNQLQSSDEISASAQSFFIYLLDRFKDVATVQVSKIHQKIESEKRQSQSKQLQELYSIIPDTLSRIVEVCDQLNKKGHLLFIKRDGELENCIVIMKSKEFLSTITGKMFAPENFREHCSIGTSTGVVPLFKFVKAYSEFDSDIIHNVIEYMTLHEFCFEIKDKHVLKNIASTCNVEEQDPQNRYFFFPGLIKLDIPWQAWEEDSTMTKIFCWALQAPQDIDFFDPHCLQVLILRLVFTFSLAPAVAVQKDIPSLQRFCSVWKNGICWGDQYGFYYVELRENAKWFILRMRSQTVSPDFLLVRSRIINIILVTVEEHCSCIEAVESIVNPQKVLTIDTLSSISCVATAVVSNATNVETMFGPQPLQQHVMFEPYAGLNENVLQCIHSRKHHSMNEKISDRFISIFSRTIVISGNNSSILKQILSNPQCKSSASHLTSPREELAHALKSWRSATDGTYTCLKDTLNKYSVFAGRNLLVKL